MANTYNTKPARLMSQEELKRISRRRKCNSRGHKSCEYCMNNLRIRDKRISILAREMD